MSVFSDPTRQPVQTGSAKLVVYAPLTLSGVVVGFNIERYPALLQPDGTLQPDEVPLAGVRVSHIYLTPRLMAKLLTESYQAQLVDVTSRRNLQRCTYHLGAEEPASACSPTPTSCEYNPEFKLLSTQQELDRRRAALVVEEPSSNSDAAHRMLWNWVLSDPEAHAWLNGQPDQWGMQVNPLYSTNPSVNPSEACVRHADAEQLPQERIRIATTPGETVGQPGSSPSSPLCVLELVAVRAQHAGRRAQLHRRLANRQGARP